MSEKVLRRTLKKWFPTWFASPLRRTVQVACLAAFLAMLFYVAFPYTARPARVWNDWTPEEVDAEKGRIAITTVEPPPESIRMGQTLYVVDASASPPDNLGPYEVLEVGDGRVVLELRGDQGPDRLERAAASFGPWSLQEAEPGSWPAHYAREMDRKEKVDTELFLALDPLVSISTAIAARAWVWSLAFAGAMLMACIVVPRGFCGYVCPMGTCLDMFDWAVSRRVRRFRPVERRWWAGLKYLVLAAVLAAAALGVLISGFVAAIPVATRGLVFLLAPLQTGLVRGWHQAPPIHAGHYLSIALFLLVLGLGLIRPRFWCKYVCPTGALFSLANVLRVTERKVDRSCTKCGRCVDICPFDAIRPDDIATRTSDCTLCRTCGGVCPAGSIRYVPRWNTVESRAEPAPAAGRRHFLSRAAGIGLGVMGGAASAATVRVFGADLANPARFRPVRPPGSVPEREFLQLCIRCGECFRACPNDALQPLGFAQGIEGLWTPHLAADWSGCEVSCNLCGRVCPTGAIRSLSLEEKRATPIGLAVVDRQACLPFAGKAECQLCVDECARAGYHAIEFMRVGTEVDDEGRPIQESGFLAPVVLPGKCVGCGLCQTRCRAINAVEKGSLDEAAIRVEAKT